MENIKSIEVLKTLEFIKNLRKIECTNYEELVTNIKRRQNQLEEMLQNYASLLCQEANRKWMEISQILSTYERRLRTYSNQQQSTDSMSCELNCSVLPIEKMPRFQDGSMSRKSISDSFGSIKRTTCFDVELQKLHSFDTILSYINPVCAVNDSTALLGCAVDNTIAYASVGSTETHLKSYQKIDVCSIAILRSGGLIFSSSTNDTTVKILTGDGLIETYHDFQPLIPKGLCISNEGGILVGLREKTTDPFCVNKLSIRQVRKLDNFGRTSRIYELDVEKKKLFTVPSRISTDGNIIYVVDTIDNEHGQIVALYETGMLRWVYEGYELSQNMFCPNDITVTSRGIIITTDTFNDALHFISTDGSVLLYQTLNSFGMYLPCSVSMDFRERLWVGCGKKGSKKAQCHILSIYPIEA
ncbi:uncharacterized protein LOC134717483 [Mytilus trossulus]|uniref:uncharacterized protein LOC134717483 n=1 Tax=Mytilus trossulus TaxID=6551 RepID=UPI0030054D70